MGKLRHRPVIDMPKAVKQQSCKELDPKSWPAALPTEMSLSAPGAADFNHWRNWRARLVMISKTSRGRGAAEELRAAGLRRGFFPAPKGRASPQSCLLCLAAGFGRRVLVTGLSPRAGHQVKNSHGVQRRWEGAGADREELEQRQAGRKGS